MSSYFDDASLVMIPSGYKTSKVYSVKPTDGSGDLTFSRSNDTATRVNSAGLIEKVRTNLYPRGSALLATGWTSVGATLTAGQTDPNGGTTALRVQLAAGGSPFSSIYQTFTGSAAIYARSVFIKGATAQTIRIVDPYTGAGSTVNLTTSYQRFTAVGAGIAPNFGIQFDNNNDAAAKDFTIAFVQIEEGDIATDYIATTTAAVSVGPVANVPRLDYLNSSCPRLLLEGQRTNNAQFSEAFDNAWWTKTNVTLTSTLGGPIDQSKYFTITCDGTTGTFKGVGKSFLNASANTYSLSVFAKAGTSSTFVISSRATLTSNDTFASFNLANGTIISQNGGTASIVNYGSGWYRCTFVVVNAGTFTNEASIFFGHPHGAANGATVLATGAMSEVGAYATSYIPTLGAAVTRGADAASKTGISSLINSSEGVLYFEGSSIANDGAGKAITLRADASNFVKILYSTVGNRVDYVCFSSGSVSCNIIKTITNATINNKIAVRWKNNDFALFINGVKEGFDVSGNTPLGMSIFSFTNEGGGEFFHGNVQSTIIFPIALSDAQLAELTA